MTEFLFSLAIHKYKILSVFWNVLLALIPCWMVYYTAMAVRQRKWKSMKWSERFALIILFLFWLMFFPNTAYLFLIPRHLVNLCGDYGKTRICFEGAWIVMFFFTYSAIGIPTFYYALHKMSQLLSQLFKKTLTAIFPLIIIPLTALGMLLGLFERFNTWQIVLQPWEIVRAGAYYFIFPALFIHFLVFTISLYIIYFGMHYFIWKIMKK